MALAHCGLLLLGQDAGRGFAGLKFPVLQDRCSSSLRLRHALRMAGVEQHQKRANASVTWMPPRMTAKPSESRRLPASSTHQSLACRSTLIAPDLHPVAAAAAQTVCQSHVKAGPLLLRSQRPWRTGLA